MLMNSQVAAKESRLLLKKFNNLNGVGSLRLVKSCRLQNQDQSNIYVAHKLHYLPGIKLLTEHINFKWKYYY